MFRIKTDIRHYRCKNRAKVERLIRNWVIRPSDLIFDGDSEEWQPIGHHPDFVELFASLDEEHQNQPATVVTARAADKAAADRPDKEDTPAPSSTGRSSAPPSAVLRSRASSAAAQPVEPEPESEPGPMAPPTPSEDVEGVIRDSDEITIMTGKTLDLLTDDETLDTTSGPPAGGVDTAAPDEPTGVVERPVFDDEPPPSASVEISLGEESSQPVIEGRRRGRHDLPEEVFVTSEIDKSEAEEEARLDELADLDDEDMDLPEEDSVMGSRRESKSRWNIVLSDMPPPDEDDENEEEEEEETSGVATDSTDEIRISTTAEPEPPPSVDPLRDTADLDFSEMAPIEEEEESEADEEEVEEDAEDGDLRDTLDLDPDEVTDPPDEEAEDADEGDDFEIDDEALDDAIEDLEAVATAVQERADDEDLEEIPFVEALPIQNLDMVSEGYKMDLPINIGPSAAMEQLGIRRTTVSDRKKDKLYSLPEPKKSGQLIKTNYNLSHRSFSMTPAVYVAIAALVVILLMALSFAL